MLRCALCSKSEWDVLIISSKGEHSHARFTWMFFTAKIINGRTWRVLAPTWKIIRGTIKYLLTWNELRSCVLVKKLIGIHYNWFGGDIFRLKRNTPVPVKIAGKATLLYKHFIALKTLRSVWAKGSIKYKNIMSLLHWKWLFLRTALKSLKAKPLNLADDALVSFLGPYLGANGCFILEKD